MILVPGVICPRGSKAQLIQSLVDYTKSEDEGYRRLLFQFTKKEIAPFLPYGGRTAAKEELINLFIALDRIPSQAASQADSQADYMTAVVPNVSPDMQDLPLVPFMPKQRKRLGKLWRSLACRKTASQKMVKHSKDLLAQPGADKMTVKDVTDAVQMRMGVAFNRIHKKNMYAFCHKTLNRLLR